MTASVTHTKVSGVSDGPDTSMVQPSDWNAGHTFSGFSTSATSFPGSPATGDRIFRSDLGLDCYYDGTRWLTVGEYAFGGTGAATGNTGISATGVTTERMPVRQDYGIYLTRWVVATAITGTNTGASFWTLALDRWTAAIVSTNVTSISTGAAPDTPSNWVNHDTAINAVLDSSARELTLTPTKTGTPSPLFYASALFCRLIVT